MAVDLNELALRMLADYDARTPGKVFGEPIDLTTVQAYDLQAEIARLRERRGERVIGYKVGCTSRTIQVQLGVHEPIIGRLFDTECHPSGVRLPAARFANLAIEGELAIRLSQDLPRRPLTDEEYTRAIESVFPVIELHHYVLPANGHPAAALIASGGMHAGLVLAARETTCSGRIPVWRNLMSPSMTASWARRGSPGRWAARPRPCGGCPPPGRVGLAASDRTGDPHGSALPLFPVKPGSRVVAEARSLGMSSVAID